MTTIKRPNVSAPRPVPSRKPAEAPASPAVEAPESSFEANRPSSKAKAPVGDGFSVAVAAPRGGTDALGKAVAVGAPEATPKQSVWKKLADAAGLGRSSGSEASGAGAGASRAVSTSRQAAEGEGDGDGGFGVDEPSGPADYGGSGATDEGSPVGGAALPDFLTTASADSEDRGSPDVPATVETPEAPGDASSSALDDGEPSVGVEDTRAPEPPSASPDDDVRGTDDVPATIVPEPEPEPEPDRQSAPTQEITRPVPRAPVTPSPEDTASFPAVAEVTLSMPAAPEPDSAPAFDGVTAPLPAVDEEGNPLVPVGLGATLDDPDVDDADVAGPGGSGLIGLPPGAEPDPLEDERFLLNDPDALDLAFAAPEPEVVEETPKPEPEAEVTVQAGDSLSRLAARHLGDASRWPELYEFNREALGDNPNAIKPGMTLELPPADYALSRAERNQLFTSAAIEPRTPAVDASDDPARGRPGYLDGGNGDDVLGYDQNGDPVPSTLTAGERSAMTTSLAAELSPPALRPGEIDEVGGKVVKSLGDLSTIFKNPAKEAAFVDALYRGQYGVLSEALKDESIGARLLEKFPLASPEALGRINLLGQVAGVGSKAVTAFEGYNQSVSTNEAGKLASGTGALYVDILLGRASPALDVLDAAVSLTSTLTDSPNLERYAGPKKNLFGLVETVTVLTEGLSSTDEAKGAALLTRFYDEVRAGKRGAAAEGYLGLADELLTFKESVATPFGLWVKERLTGADAAREAELQRNRDFIRRNSG